MTAEIAILNKTAVALAADSAITISGRGNRGPKIYNSAHKLFELSMTAPIGIMINNDIHFMETPLPVIIMDYRKLPTKFEGVADAARGFREYLKEFADNAPALVKERHLCGHFRPLIANLRDRIDQEVVSVVTTHSDVSGGQPLEAEIDNAISNLIRDFGAGLRSHAVAEICGDGYNLTDDDKAAVRNVVDEGLTGSIVNGRQRGVIKKAVLANAHRVLWSTVTTGIVIAGFGSKELFPTLVSFDLCGYIGGCLRYLEKEVIDIDRTGARARVVPFAQGEMVERFIYGIDGKNFDQITTPYAELLANYRTLLLDQIDLDVDARSKLEAALAPVEKKLFEKETKKAFEKIYDAGRIDIQEMVEFMPKSELADMAEALINITAIKRRVSRGSETVGGPIDVAVISKSEGFVWVRHKHYFSPALNPGYFERIRSESDSVSEVTNG
jgi:hypothetical protein